MNFFGKHGTVYSVYKLTAGTAWSTAPGCFLNSPARWQYVGTVVAKSEVDAETKAKYQHGSSQIRVEEDQTGEML